MIKQVNTKLDMINFIQNELSAGDIKTFLFQSKSGKLFAWDFSKQTHVPVADGTSEQINPYYKEPVSESTEEVEEETFEDTTESDVIEEPTMPAVQQIMPEVVEEKPTILEQPKVTEEPKVVTPASEKVVVEAVVAETIVETVTKDHHNEIVNQYKLRMEDLKTAYEGQLEAKAKEIADLHSVNTSLREEKEALNVKIEHLKSENKQLKNTANTPAEVALDKFSTVELVSAIAKQGFVVQLTFKN